MWRPTSGLTDIYVTLRSCEDLSVRPQLKVGKWGGKKKKDLCCRFIMLAVNGAETFCSFITLPCVAVNFYVNNGE